VPRGGRDRPVRAKPEPARARAQQQDVVAVHHRRVRGRSIPLPDRTAVERLQRCRPQRHVCERTNPHEAIRTIEIAKLAEDRHPCRLLPFDEFPLEKLDQHVPLSRVQRVLAKLDDGLRQHWGRRDDNSEREEDRSNLPHATIVYANVVLCNDHLLPEWYDHHG
jgi:hypothetical protein